MLVLNNWALDAPLIWNYVCNKLPFHGNFLFFLLFQAIALAKAQEDATLEQEKVIKKLKKAHEKALKVCIRFS